ncbi:AraC-like DNA-binding protein [Lipingzhangella halophila]|uniref:AraC-like DNA-binding protein n=1 Tax=Lipingzhangella halophila TaxID=1783352 RepID=A0A7W7REJ2_9ACTN|nr:helix-turn-helix domain-containing protein [Lipingzhangella halophila]MBB4930543.1 AraC-like DNA-binding protein [Lipingzhangella halophila]
MRKGAAATRPGGTTGSLGFDDYRMAASQAVTALDMHSARPEEFQGRLTASGTGDIRVFDIRADEHTVHRTPAHLHSGSHHDLKFTMIEQGGGMVVQDGRETLLRTGDMAIYDTDRPYSLLFDDSVRLSVVMFPKELLEIPCPDIGRLTALRLDANSSVSAMVRPYLARLAQQASELDEHVARRLLRSAVDMVGTVIEANLVQVPAQGTHATLMRRILDFIDDNLASPELNPARIASAHFISVRQLHALFSVQGATVSTVIRTRRLERCYDDLVSSRQAGRSVSAIAAAHGFVDAAHFSRTFRARFGVPPSSVRPPSS